MKIHVGISEFQKTLYVNVWAVIESGIFNWSNSKRLVIELFTYGIEASVFISIYICTIIIIRREQIKSKYCIMVMQVFFFIRLLLFNILSNYLYDCICTQEADWKNKMLIHQYIQYPFNSHNHFGPIIINVIIMNWHHIHHENNL